MYLVGGGGGDGGGGDADGVVLVVAGLVVWPFGPACVDCSVGSFWWTWKGG